MTDETCPVCGEPYTHTVTKTPDQPMELRQDFTRCLKQEARDKVRMYIHNQGPIVRSVRSADGEEGSLLGRLFTDD